MNKPLVHDPRQQYSPENNAIPSEIPNINSCVLEPASPKSFTCTNKTPKSLENPPLPTIPRRRSLLTRLFDSEGGRRRGSNASSVYLSDGDNSNNSSIQSWGSGFSGVKKALKGANDALSKNNEMVRRKKRREKASNTSPEKALVAKLAQMEKEFHKMKGGLELKVAQRDDAIKTLERALSLQTKTLERLRTENNKLTREMKLERDRKSDLEANGNNKRLQNGSRTPFSLTRRLERKQIPPADIIRDKDSSFRAYRKGQRLRLDYHASLSNNTDQLEKILQLDGYRKDSTFSKLEKNSSSSSLTDKTSSLSSFGMDKPSIDDEPRRVTSSSFLANNTRSSKASRNFGYRESDTRSEEGDRSELRHVSSSLFLATNVRSSKSGREIGYREVDTRSEGGDSSGPQRVSSSLFLANNARSSKSSRDIGYREVDTRSEGGSTSEPRRISSPPLFASNTRNIKSSRDIGYLEVDTGSEGGHIARQYRSRKDVEPSTRHSAFETYSRGHSPIDHRRMR